MSSYPNYIDIPLAGVSSKDAVVIDISPSSAYFAAQAQFTNTESMDGAVRIRAKNIPTAAIKGQWYVIHGGGSVYEGELHNYYDKAAVDKLLAGKLGLHDTADNSNKLNGYELRLFDHPGSTNILVQTVYEDGRTCIDCRNDASIGLTAIVASGSNYVRFGDGTQICWGLVQLNGAISDSNLRVTFPLPFIDTPRIFPSNNANVGVGINVGIGWEDSTSFTIGTSGVASNGYTSWFAIGRWK